MTLAVEPPFAIDDDVGLRVRRVPVAEEEEEKRRMMRRGRG